MVERTTDKTLRRAYKVQYWIDPKWNQSMPLGTQLSPQRESLPGVRLVKGDQNCGYADDLFVMSIVRNPQGEIESMLVLSTEGLPGGPSRELLEAVRDQIDHHLRHHV